MTAPWKPTYDQAYLDGQDSARCDEPKTEYWDLIDLGYAPLEALYFLRGYEGAAP